MSETQPAVTSPPAVVGGSLTSSTWDQTVAALAAIAGLSSFCYVFGFLCVNAYLGHYGAVVFSLLDAQFLAVGLGFGLLFAIVGLVFLLRPSILPSQLWGIMTERRAAGLNAQQQAANRWFRAGYEVSYAISFFISYTIVFILSMWLYLLVVLVLTYVACRLFGMPLRSIFGTGSYYFWVATVVAGITLSADLIRSRGAERRNLIPIVIIVFCSSAFFYSDSLYPALPGWIGGGRPVAVRLLFDPANKDSVAALFGPGSSFTADGGLVAETSDYFVVMVTSGGKRKLVQIKKDLVQGISYGGS